MTMQRSPIAGKGTRVGNRDAALGQIAVAAVLLPLMARLRTTPVFTRRWVPACSALVVLAGSYWLVERTWMS